MAHHFALKKNFLGGWLLVEFDWSETASRYKNTF